jgi:NADH-quinone oxidoreductase subunit M
MNSIPLLSSLIFIPFFGALLMAFIPEDKTGWNAKMLALWSSMTTFFLSLYMWSNYVPDASGYQFEEIIPWIPAWNVSYHVGVDGLSLYFVLLSTFLTPICILASFNTIKHKIRSYMMAFLILETFMIGTFCALDLVLFYIFFEGVLIPMFFIIGIWGGDNRIYACFKFFLYTFLGSLLMLAAFVYVYKHTGSADFTKIIEFANTSFDHQKWVWWALFIAFAVKMPMFPVHTWLPDAHVQAPTAGSVILAGVLLKMGGYGFLRLLLPLCPDASHHFAYIVIILSLIAIVYAALVAFAQHDMKKLIAYSSISHMGYVTMGIFSFNDAGVSGSIFQMISHGIVSSALFLCVGVVYDRFHTREIAFYGGLVQKMPVYAVLFLTFTMASAGLPGTSGFVGEFMTILGFFHHHPLLSFIAASGMIFSAMYGLWLYRRVMYQKIVNPALEDAQDLTMVETGNLGILAVIAIVIGIYPNSILRTLNPYTDKAIQSFKNESINPPALPSMKG